MSTDASKPERYDQGHCEVEVCTHAHGEADLQRALIMCDKNPGHADFIPVYKFRMEHLPAGFQDDCLLELIQVLSHLTVRVALRYTSESRPQICPHNGTPYPFYMQRDTNMTRTGSGWVWNVESFSQMYDQKTCPCQECRQSEFPETKWAEIVIGSAAHVVFDDKEGEHTICHLFYDKGSTPEICPGVVTLRGMYRVDTNIKEDKCKMIYITHDMELAERLETLTKRFVDLQKILSQKYNSNLDSLQTHPKRGESSSRNYAHSRLQKSKASPSKQTGQSQKVSSERLHSRSLTHGRLQSQNVSPERPSGSSTSDRSRPRFVPRRGVNSKISAHGISQSSTDATGLSELRHTVNNRSPLRSITTNISALRNVSNNEILSQNTSDIHLPKIIVTSHNSDNHKLASQLQNELGQSNSRKALLDKSPTRHPVLIQSKERNVIFKRIESTHAPRLVSQTRLTRNTHSDSRTLKAGKIAQITTKDRQSVAMTARSNQSDSAGSNQSGSNNVRGNQPHSTSTNAKALESRCIASDKGQSAYEQFSRNFLPRRPKPRQATSHEPQLILSRRSQSTDARADTAANPALTVIVSHPHGCNKQITIGYYTERVEVKDSRNLTRYVYTTPTCPGSSGAPVYVLGRWRGWWPCDHPHSGNSDINRELNFSGVGLH
ncbi:hypothetical protein BsWGS_17158 [Bradybaena similaris]